MKSLFGGGSLARLRLRRCYATFTSPRAEAPARQLTKTSGLPPRWRPTHSPIDPQLLRSPLRRRRGELIVKTPGRKPRGKRALKNAYLAPTKNTSGFAKYRSEATTMLRVLACTRCAGTARVLAAPVMGARVIFTSLLSPPRLLHIAAFRPAVPWSLRLGGRLRCD